MTEVVDAVADEAVERFEEQFVAPGQEGEKVTSAADWFRKAVTLPKDEVTIYTDAQAAWEYVRLMDRQAEISAQISALGSRKEVADKYGQGGSIADTNPTAEELVRLNEEYDRFQENKPGLIEELNKSGVVCQMRALYPAEIRTLTRIATREANKTWEGNATPADEDRDEVRGRFLNAHYLSVAVTGMAQMGGGVLPAPLSADDWLAISDTLDLGEYDKLVRMLNQLNMRAAVKDARTDAGFPS
jgi:hypothetical protein